MNTIFLNTATYIIPDIRDPQFGEQGVINLFELKHELDLDRHIKGMEVLPDNRILAGLWLAHNLVGVYALARFNPDGSVDTSFADEGLAQGNFAQGYDSSGGAVSVDAHGRIMMLGWSREVDIYSPKRLVVARFDSEGAVDTDFGQDGCVLMESSAFGEYVDDSASMGFAADGKMLIAASYRKGDRLNGVVWRIDAQGNLDNSFNHTGCLLISHAAFTGMSVTALVVQADNSILVAGEAQHSGYESQGYVARYSSTGELDVLFGSADTPGLSVVYIPGGNVIFHHMLCSDDGNFVAVGQASLGRRNWGLLVGLASNGEENPEFNGGRPVLTSFNTEHGNEWVCAHRQADGKIITAGGSRRLYAARYLPNGSIDRSFGMNGCIQEDTILVTTPAVIKTQTNSRILLAGNTLGIGGALGHIYGYVG